MEKSKEKSLLLWLARYKPYIMVLLSATMLILSFPPFPFAFLSYIAFIPLLLVIDQTPDRIFEDKILGFFKAVVVTFWRFITLQFLWRFRGKPWVYKRKIISHNAEVFRYTYTAFLLWNLGCCYWLMLTAVSVEESEAVSAFISGLMANLVNPFLMTIPIYFYTRARKALPLTLHSITFLLFWVTFEWLHFQWDLSWSWITLGHCLTYYPDYIQYLEFTGIFGASIHILLTNVLVYQAIKLWQNHQQAAIWRMVIVLVWLLLPIMLNPFILNPEREVFQSVGTMNVRVIQPNIDPYEKFQQQTRVAQIARFDSLIRLEGIDTIDLAVLPETAIPKGMWTHELRYEKLIRPLWKTVEEYEFSLLTGINEFRLYDPADMPFPPSVRKVQDFYYDACNSSLMMRKDSVPQTFQKAKLVPMVERVPFLNTFRFLSEHNVDIGGGFGSYGLPDTIKTLLPHTNVPISSLICYESEYGDYVRKFTLAGAQMFLIITNDGWWLESSGHIQHAHFTSLRAIENRREIPRSANTGISLFSDNKGHLHQLTDYWTIDYQDRKVKLYDSITFYVKHGNYLGWICGISSLLVILWLAIRLIWDRRKRFGKERFHL